MNAPASQTSSQTSTPSSSNCPKCADANTQPPNPHRDYWAPVKSIDATDDATVKVTLSSYSDNWLFHMAAGSACIISTICLRLTTRSARY